MLSSASGSGTCTAQVSWQIGVQRTSRCWARCGKQVAGLAAVVLDLGCPVPFDLRLRVPAVCSAVLAVLIAVSQMSLFTLSLTAGEDAFGGGLVGGLLGRAVGGMLRSAVGALGEQIRQAQEQVADVQVSRSWAVRAG